MFLIRWSKRGKFAQDVIGLFPAFNQTPVDMGKPVLRWSKREYKKNEREKAKICTKKEKNTKSSTKHLWRWGNLRPGVKIKMSSEMSNTHANEYNC